MSHDCTFHRSSSGAKLSSHSATSLQALARVIPGYQFLHLLWLLGRAPEIGLALLIIGFRLVSIIVCIILVVVARYTGGVTEVTTSSFVLSHHGERHIACLTRAILRFASLLCLTFNLYSS